MTRDIIEINDFIVLIEQSTEEETIVDKCGFDDQVIVFSFYGSGNVALNIHYGDNTRAFNNTKGIAISFFANDKVEFVHNISNQQPLQCICIVTRVKNLEALPNEEGKIFSEYLHQLVNPQDDYVEGPNFYMTHDMQSAVDKIFNTSYTGKTRIMFLRSQITELLSHFFALLSDTEVDGVKERDREKIYQAKEILTNNIETPPSLNELSKLIGLNSYKLKKNFKALFGIPVFKYLQNERLNKAHDLLRDGDTSIQEAAWKVGYESVSSFSNAFIKKFGFRPSEIRK
ncbi:helix-turn-helix transcriptional regulator [Fulvivirga sp. M361]|uniref:helix-turn-helix domain-containing protein n=1 Tax=Fulvivirga sp. M361 TaxID=2594266 RepID=UPI00117B30AB|nr:AraC family transcriptional regulator [Fulvivirga sp. M361]TRX61704.1 helix-turn-helix transcriptional regulator [Fulvivirga sp. M361]